MADDLDVVVDNDDAGPLFAPAPWVKPDPVLAELSALRTEVTELRTELREVIALVGTTLDQVRPTIESLAGNPLLKMLGGKGRG